MKPKIKVFLYFASVIVLSTVLTLTILFVHYKQGEPHYYPMGGNVTVTDKLQTTSAYYLVIAQDAPNEQFVEFVLLCTKEQYNSVDIGDSVNCEREQSLATHTGIIHKLKPSGSSWPN